MDSIIIDKIKNKNVQGLDILIDTYSKNIYYIVNCILKNYGSSEDIEECVSDILMTIWNDIESFDERKGTFKTFILIKSKYEALSYKRKLSKSILKSIPIDNENIKDEKIVEDIISYKDNIKQIIGIIKTFKEPDKTYFYLRYFMDYDLKDIAIKFNDTINAVSNRLYRCRLKIKDFFKEEV